MLDIVWINDEAEIPRVLNEPVERGAHSRTGDIRTDVTAPSKVPTADAEVRERCTAALNELVPSKWRRQLPCGAKQVLRHAVEPLIADRLRMHGAISRSSSWRLV